jgi:hypothetical protein
MEDDLKILRVEYILNYLLDHTQISNLSLDDQTKFYKSWEWRQPPTEDNLRRNDDLKTCHTWGISS